MEYRDFDLLIERSGQGYRAQVLESPAGQATAEFTLPFSDLVLENVLLRLGRPLRTVRRVESTELSTAKSFGAALFNAVFSGDVRACLRSSVDEAKREAGGIRVRLRLADPALADLPWEFLYVQSVNRFLALSVRTPLVRYMDLPEVLQPIAVSPPIRVLAMISSPTDYPSLDVEGEWQRLNDALADLIKAGTLSLERMEEATLAALQRRLRRSKYHIFHFVGHGEFDQTLHEGVLLLEREKHRGHRVGSQYLGMLLHDHESLRVAVLNACKGARSSKQDPFAGSAQTLVQQGIPAVIAMQFEIADDVAQTFAHEFYGALANSYPIDAAVTEARKAIFAMGREVEWATPVLYLRAPDGRIFDVDRTARVPASATVAQPAAESPAPPPVIASQLEPLEAMTPKEQSAALLRSAGRALGAGEYAGALEVLQQVRALDPSSPALADLAAMAEGQRAVAETRARRRAEFREHLDAAAGLLARNDLAAASARVAEALRLQPADPEARAVQGQIARTIEEGWPAGVAGRHREPERAETASTPTPLPSPDDPSTPGPPVVARESQPSDVVHCTVFSPQQTAAGQPLLVHVTAHVPEQAQEAATLVGRSDPQAEPRVSTVLPSVTPHVSRLTFCLSMPGAEVDDPVQTLIWKRVTESVQFQVRIPADCAGSRLIGTVAVSQDGIPFGRIKFVVSVSSEGVAKAVTEKKSEWRRYRHAFVSYASADRTEVLKRVQMLARVSISFFQDLLNLEPGERWQRELYKQIDRSDVFFLFWSTAARNSEWVAREIDYALRRKGGDELAEPEIVPIIIEGPPPVPPPPALRHLHFDDPLMYFIQSTASHSGQK